MFRYAQINKEGNIISDSMLSGEVLSDNMIRVPVDFELTGKKYNLDTMKFEEVVIEPTEPTKTVDERLEAIELTQDIILLKVEGVIV